MSGPHRMPLSARASAAVDAPVAGAAGSGESHALRGRSARGVRPGFMALAGDPPSNPAGLGAGAALAAAEAGRSTPDATGEPDACVAPEATPSAAMAEIGWPALAGDIAAAPTAAAASSWRPVPSAPLAAPASPGLTDSGVAAASASACARFRSAGVPELTAAPAPSPRASEPTMGPRPSPPCSTSNRFPKANAP